MIWLWVNLSSSDDFSEWQCFMWRTQFEYDFGSYIVWRILESTLSHTHPYSSCGFQQYSLYCWLYRWWQCHLKRYMTWSHSTVMWIWLYVMGQMRSNGGLHGPLLPYTNTRDTSKRSQVTHVLAKVTVAPRGSSAHSKPIADPACLAWSTTTVQGKPSEYVQKVFPIIIVPPSVLWWPH